MKRKKLDDAFGIFNNSVGKISDKQSRIYTDGLVLWLGTYQALEFASCRGSLEELESLRAVELYGECKRKYAGKVSGNSSAIVQARQGIELETLQDATVALYEYIRQDHLWNGYRIIGTDGSTVALNQSNAKLLKSYPGGEDHKGKSRWPIVHMVLLIDLLEGIVITGNLGAKYGKCAVSEQSMTLDLMDFVKEKALLVGDRNFGTFQMAKEYSEHGTEVLFRLSKPAAKYIANGIELIDGLDQAVVWKPTAGVITKHGYQKQDEVHGRLIVKKFQYKDKEVEVVLFTTLTTGTADELVGLYRKRWSFEEDLKTMKQQLKLKNVQSATKAAVDVEIFCKLLAFNITRGIVLLAVQDTDIDPRRISFALAFLIVRRNLQEYSDQKTNTGKQKVLEYMLKRIRLARIPDRPGRSYERKVYGRRPGRYKTVSSRL